MEIIYSSSNAYACIAAVSIISLCENNRDAEEICFHVISNNINAKNSKRLIHIAQRYNRKLEIIDMPDMNELTGVAIAARQYNMATFARLCLGVLFPHLNRVIFIDCDTLVTGSLKALWETELQEGNLMAGVLDAVSRRNKQRIGIDADALYVNVGVLLADLSLWREERIHERFFAFLRLRNGSVPIVDQGVINAVAKGRIQKLSSVYNVMTYLLTLNYHEMKRYKKPRNYYTEVDYENARNNPIVLHATNQFLVDRPWVEDSNYPYVKQWRFFYAMTPWGNERLKSKHVSLQLWILRILCRTPLRRLVLETLGILQASVKM